MPNTLLSLVFAVLPVDGGVVDRRRVPPVTRTSPPPIPVPASGMPPASSGLRAGRSLRRSYRRFCRPWLFDSSAGSSRGSDGRVGRDDVLWLLTCLEPFFDQPELDREFSARKLAMPPPPLPPPSPPHHRRRRCRRMRCRRRTRRGSVAAVARIVTLAARGARQVRPTCARGPGWP